jgi:hypothetical protein
MNNQEIWNRFILNNSQWKNLEFSDEKIQLTYYQLKNIVEIAAKYARIDEMEKLDSEKIAENNLKKFSDSKSSNKANDSFQNIFGSILDNKK